MVGVSEAWGRTAFVVWVLLGVGACGPTRTLEAPVIQGGYLEYGALGSAPPREATGRVLNASVYPDGDTYWVRLRFASPYQCESYLRATRTLAVGSSAAPLATIPVGLGFAECEIGVETSDVSFPLRDFRAALATARGGDTSLNLYADYRVTFEDDGRADRIDSDGNPVELVGTASFRIYVSELKPGVRPHITDIAPSAPLPGWDREITPADVAAYESDGGIVAGLSTPFRAHQGVSWEFTRTMAFVHVDGRPRGASASDRGEGIVYPVVGERPYGAGFVYPFGSDVGLVPGRVYDLFIRGAAGLSDLDAPASIALDGTPLEPSVGAAVPLDAPIRLADTRLSFRVAPIRIESPRRRALAGLTATAPASTRITGAIALDTIVQPVPGSARVRARIVRRSDDDVVLDADLGTYAAVVAGGSDQVLAQAGEHYDVRAFSAALDIPAGNPLLGIDDDDDPRSYELYSLSIDVVASDGVVLFGDTRDAAFDLAPPQLPSAACATSGPRPGDTCVWIDDTDDRDCAVEEVCVAGGSSDIVSLSVTVCDVEVTVPAVFDAGRGALCTGPVDTGGSSTAATRGSATVVAIDDAGNVSVPFGGSTCFRSPPRVLSTLDNRLPLGGAVARTSTGRPLTVTIDATNVRPFHTQLTVSIWDGATWQRQILDASSADRSWVYRGRIDREELADGGLLFCATRREVPTRAGAGFGSTLDDLDPALEGRVDLIHVRPDGSASITEVDSARPFGCGVTASELLGDEQIVVAYADTQGPVGTSLSASPTFTTCERGGGALTCRANTVARSLLRTFPLFGQDIDAAFDGAGRLHIVGRGLLSTGPSASFEEYSVFRVRVNPSLDSAVFDRVLREVRVTPTPGGACPTFSDGYRAPRLATVDDRLLLVYEEYGNPGFPRPDGNAIRVRGRSLATTALGLGPAVEIGLATAGGRHGFGRAWPSGLVFAGPPRSPCSTIEDSVPVAFDLTSGGPESARTEGRVVFVTRDDVPGFGTGLLSAFRPTTGLHDASLVFMGGGLSVSTRLIDAEVARVTSEDRGAAQLPPEFPSVFLDSSGEATALTNRSLSSGFDFLYFEERARQWLEPRAGTRGTCDERAQIVLHENALNLGLNTPFRNLPWATVRIPTMLSTAYPNYSSNVACALDGAMEGLVPPLRNPGEGDGAFYRDVRHAFGSAVMSMASMIESPNRPAMVVGRELENPGTVTVPASFRRLRVEVNGRLLDVTRTAPSNLLVDVVTELNTSLGGTAARPVIALIEETRANARTFQASRVAVLGWAPAGSTARPTVRVLSGTLRSWLGLDGDLATGLGRVLDASEGDRHGRLRSCSDACTTETCTLPRDCIDMNPGSAPAGLEDNLLYHATNGLHLVDGMPPLRAGQTGICVPLEQRTDPRACVPSSTTRHRGGTPSDYPAFERYLPLTGSCAANEEVTVGDDEFGEPRLVCSGCGGASATGVPEGSPRLCRVDTDCNPARECTDGSCSSLTAAGTSLCTHLAGEFMGVPAGVGFCAAPILCPRADSTCASRAYDGFEQPPYAQSLLVYTVSGFGVPAPLDVGAGDFGVRVATVECAMTGCTLCTGTDVNGFCETDDECAPGHVCLRSTARDLALETPACLLRPILHDGRLLDLPAYTASSGDPSVRNLNFNTSVVPPATGIVTAAVDTLQATLDNTLRAIVIPARITSDPLDISPPGADAVLLDAIDAHLAGAVLAVRPLPSNVVVSGYRPGTDAVLATVFLDGELRVAGRTQFELSDALEGEGRFAARIVNVRAFTLWLVPYVAQVGGVDRLQFRSIAPVFLESSVARGDAADVPINNDNVSLDIADGLEALVGLLEFAAIFAPIVTDALTSLIVEYIVSSPAPGWFSGALALPVDPVAGLYTSLATTPFVGPILFGLSPVVERPRTYPDGTLGAFALEDGFARAARGLELRYRGADLGDDIAELLGLQGVAVTSGVSACCIGAEPDPSCLESAPPDMDSRCPPVSCTPASP